MGAATAASGCSICSMAAGVVGDGGDGEDGGRCACSPPQTEWEMGGKRRGPRWRRRQDNICQPVLEKE